MSTRLSGVLVVVPLFATQLLAQSSATTRTANATLSAVPGIRVGHHTLTERLTGCTVILAGDGARALTPIHTMADGDTVFTLATGGLAGEANVTRIGALAADVMAEAIVRAIRAASSIPGYPAVRDWPR